VVLSLGVEVTTTVAARHRPAFVFAKVVTAEQLISYCDTSPMCSDVVHVLPSGD